MPAPTNPPLYPKLVDSFIVTSSVAKTSDVNVTAGIPAYTAPSTCKFARVRKLTAKPLATPSAATRLKAYIAKAAALTVLGIVRDRLLTTAAVSEAVATSEIDFNYGAAEWVYLAPSDVFYVAQGVASCTVEWYGEVEIF